MRINVAEIGVGKNRIEKMCAREYSLQESSLGGVQIIEICLRQIDFAEFGSVGFDIAETGILADGVGKICLCERCVAKIRIAFRESDYLIRLQIPTRNHFRLRWKCKGPICNVKECVRRIFGFGRASF